MTMTMTIWWPRSSVWIYQIVTGVTSVVGVPSTHLVIIIIIIIVIIIIIIIIITIIIIDIIII